MATKRLGSIVLLVLAGAVALYAGLQAPAKSSDTAKTAEQQFKNIQVLKGIPADQLIPTMQFITASLNVECTFCHVEREFQKDDKKPKQIARKMMQMQMAINANNFEGHQQVTCNTCHRGSTNPVSVPEITEGGPRPPMGEEADEAKMTLPSAEQVVEKYVSAIGGKSAIGKLTSLSEKGTMSGFGGHQMPIEIYTKAPGDRVSIAHMPMGESVTAVNHQGGWLGMGNRPPREMSTADANGYRLEAAFALAPNLDQVFEKLRVVKTEKIGDRDTLLVIGMRQEEPPVRMNFDQQSGLLVRLTRYTQTALGRNPVQIDFGDYREIDGVTIPYRWTLGRPNGSFSIQVEQAQANVPIDDAKFAKPEAPAGNSQTPGPGH
ncbi:MAG TPA: c-type cytochrome [Terriglobales bacterium]|nr:c-type cytochrome [Terriglobales bacterium]